jgi:hypothetical protein
VSRFETNGRFTPLEWGSPGGSLFARARHSTNGESNGSCWRLRNPSDWLRRATRGRALLGARAGRDILIVMFASIPCQNFCRAIALSRSSRCQLSSVSGKFVFCDSARIYQNVIDASHIFWNLTERNEKRPRLIFCVDDRRGFSKPAVLTAELERSETFRIPELAHRREARAVSLGRRGF